MPETYKRTKLAALMEKLAVEEGYDEDGGAIAWLCDRISMGWTWRVINDELRPKLQDVYGVHLDQPYKQIWFWLKHPDHPERKVRYQEARATANALKGARADRYAEEAEELLFKDPPATLTGTEAAMIKERSKFLMDKAKRVDPDTYAEPAEEKTSITLNLGEMHLQALQAAGGYAALPKPEPETPIAVETEHDEDDDENIVEADYELEETG